MTSAGHRKSLRLSLSSAKATVTHLTRSLWSPTLTDSERALAQARLLSARQLVDELRRDLARERSASC